MDELQIALTPYSEAVGAADYALDRLIFDLDSQLEMLSSKADAIDCLVSIGSGVLCGMLDILWVGELSLERCRDYASTKIDGFVVKTAKELGFKDGDVSSAFLKEAKHS